VTAGGIIRAIQRVGQRAKPTYQALVTAINESPMVVPDETGWRENGQSRWEWVFATPATTVYLITKGRGFADASLVLPADYAGTIVRDGWVAYREYDRARHQSCLGHLLHRCDTLTTDHPHSAFAPAVQAILQAGLAARDRWRARQISDHGAAVIRGQLVHQLDLVLDAPGPLADMRRFARHLDREFRHLFTFLTDLDLDATNYRAEQAIRPSVAIRKVCGGNRSPLGIETQYLLSSLLRTAVQRNVDIPATITTLLRSPVPIVPAGLRAPPC
jgi:transposase